MTMEECIKHKLPFQCEDWAALIEAFTNAYDPSWMKSLPDLIASLCDIHQFVMNQGSWNIPLLHPQSADADAYKVFLSPKKYKGILVQYEFHPAVVPMDKWIDAEISSSASLTGLTEAFGGRFHMLMDLSQAKAYVDGRNYTTEMYAPFEPCIFKVKGKTITSVDLIYSPPTSFMWGIDSRQMFVESNQLKQL